MNNRLSTFAFPALPHKISAKRKHGLAFSKGISWVSLVVLVWGGLVQGIPMQAAEWLTDLPAAQASASKGDRQIRINPF
jgi:hypothetical protein